MNDVMAQLNEDPDSKTEFFKTLFDKMHLSLKNIKAETFVEAQKNLEIIKSLMDFDGAIQTFVDSSNFYNSTMNGKAIARQSYLGRYLCFSALAHETKSWHKSDLNLIYHKLKQDQINVHIDKVGMKFHKFHEAIADIIKKMMKNKGC